MTIDPDSIDYFRDPDVIPDPYPYFAALRDRCPVELEPHHDVHMVTGHAEALSIYSDSTHFSACNAMSGPFPGLAIPPGTVDATALIETLRHSLPMSREITTMDPPTHTAYRSIVSRLFTPRNVARVEGGIADLADELIDGFVATGRCDLGTSFAEPFTLLNICELLGLPDDERAALLDDMIGDHRDRRIGNSDEGTPADPFAFLHDRFLPHLTSRRAHPADDMMSALATATFPDGSTPDLIDAVRLASILFVAGVGTTAILITTAMRTLAENPIIQDALRADPESIPNFVEEVLRHDPPVKGGFRLAKSTASVGGVDIPTGATVMLAIAGANRDGRRFESPDEFRLDRADSRQHLAFGHGIHVCVGAPLARAEARIAIERLLARLDDIQVDDDVHGPAHDRQYDFIPSFITRGLQRLSLTFTPLSDYVP